MMDVDQRESYFEVEVPEDDLIPSIRSIRRNEKDFPVSADMRIFERQMTPLETEYLNKVQRLLTIKRGYLLTVAVKAWSEEDAATIALQHFLNHLLREETSHEDTYEELSDD